MDSDVIMLAWMVAGVAASGVAIFLLRHLVSPVEVDPHRHSISATVTRWVARRHRRSVVPMVMMAVILAAICFSSAQRTYGRLNAQVANRRQERATPSPQTKGLLDQLTQDHSQSVQDGKLHQWQDQVIALGPDAVKLMAPLLDDIKDPRLKSDILYCMQQARGRDLGIRRGKVHSPDEIKAAVRALSQ